MSAGVVHAEGDPPLATLCLLARLLGGGVATLCMSSGV